MNKIEKLIPFHFVNMCSFTWHIWILIVKAYRLLLSDSSSRWSSSKLSSTTGGASLLWSPKTPRRPPDVSRRGGRSCLLQPRHPPPTGQGARQPSAAPWLLHPHAGQLSPCSPGRRVWGVGTAGTGSTRGVSAEPAGTAHRTCAYNGAHGETGDPRWRAGNTRHTPGPNSSRCRCGSLLWRYVAAQLRFQWSCVNRRCIARIYSSGVFWCGRSQQMK